MLIVLSLILQAPVAHAQTLASGECGEDLRWELDNRGTLTISGSGIMRSYQVTYSSDDTPWAAYKPDITRIIIQEGVTAIGDSAFEYCTALTSVSIPDSVTVIGQCAFKNCTSLVELNLGNGLTTLKKEAFSLCKDLREVTLPESLTTMNELAFSNCESLMYIIIPDGVSWFGRRMFYECTSLIYISLPDTIGGIDGETFAWCESLWHVFYRGRRSYIDTPHGAAIPNQYFRDATKHYQTTGQEIIPERIESTCAAAGTLTFTCALCEESRSVALPLGKHTWKAATCTAPRTCMVCDATIGNPLGSDHVWDEGTVIQDPTDDMAGVMHYTCTVCSETKVEIMENQEVPAEPQPMSGTAIFIIIIVSLVAVILGAAAVISLIRRKI